MNTTAAEGITEFVHTSPIAGTPLIAGIFGKPEDWHPDRLTDDQKRRIGVWAQSVGVHTLLLPRVAGGQGEFANTGEFHYGEYIGAGVTLFTGPKADVTYVAKGCARLVAAADCPVVAAYNNERGNALVLHAGRDSIFPDRTVPLDVALMRGVFRWMGILPLAHHHKSVQCSVLPCIRSRFSHSPDHPRYGESNQRLLSLLRKLGEKTELRCIENEDEIDMGAVATAVPRLLGIPSGNIRTSPRDTRTDPGLWSNVKDKQRNLIAVAFPT